MEKDVEVDGPRRSRKSAYALAWVVVLAMLAGAIAVVTPLIIALWNWALG